MDDQPKRTEGTDEAPKPAESADEAFGWTTESTDGQGAGATAEGMLGQLQAMIDQIATQAAPVVRQIGAKAAELAAAAADRAGPIAHKAADATADASVKIAERSRGLAADLRRELAERAGAAEDAAESLGGTATTVIDDVADAAEQATKDEPAPGV